jgi:hypothetical protein
MPFFNIQLVFKKGIVAGGIVIARMNHNIQPSFAVSLRQKLMPQVSNSTTKLDFTYDAYSIGLGCIPLPINI